MEIKKLGFYLMQLPIFEEDAGKINHEALCGALEQAAEYCETHRH